MDALPRLVDQIKRGGWAQQHFLGLLHVLVGRRITRLADDVVVSTGVSWRDLTAILKKVRWDPDAVQELGLDPKELPPRDRARFWYIALTKADLNSSKAVEAGDRFVQILRQHGYEAGPAPGAS
jgi:hypothetical protein